MKKSFVVYMLFAIFVLSLTACSGKSQWKDEFIFESDIKEKEMIPSGDDPLPDYVESADEYKPTWIDMDPSDMPYQYANMFKSASGASVIDTLKELLFIGSYPGKLVLMEYKKDSGAIEPFCKLATCSHTREECVAGNADRMDYRNGLLSMGRTKDNGDRWISQLNNGRFEFVVGPMNSFIQGDDGYYSITDDASLVRFKFGSDKPELLVEEFAFIKPMIVGNYLYAADVEDIVRVDLRGAEYSVEILVRDVVGMYSTDGEVLYYLKMENEGPALYRCDLEGNNQELVLNNLIFPAYLSYDNDYI